MSLIRGFSYSVQSAVGLSYAWGSSFFSALGEMTVLRVSFGYTGSLCCLLTAMYILAYMCMYVYVDAGSQDLFPDSVPQDTLDQVLTADCCLCVQACNQNCVVLLCILEGASKFVYHVNGIRVVQFRGQPNKLGEKGRVSHKTHVHVCTCVCIYRISSIIRCGYY